MKLYKVNGKWLNLGQIADMVGVSRPTIYNRINKIMKEKAERQIERINNERRIESIKIK